MGSPMARCLLRAGFRVTVYDLSDEPVRELAAAGATPAASPAAAARESDVVWLMVHASQVGEALSGADGVLSAVRAGAVVVDGGNCDPDVSRRHAAEAARRGVAFLDAGCSGGPLGAADGSLAIMVGGDEAAYDRCIPIFQAVGGRIAHVGPSGSGHLAKVVNNMITKMTDFVIAEALALASKAGLDVAALLDVLTTGAARSWILSQAAELFHQPQDDRYRPTFSETPPPAIEEASQLIWAVRIAGGLGVPAPMAALAAELFKASPSGGRSDVFTIAAQLVHKHGGERIDSPTE